MKQLILVSYDNGIGYGLLAASNLVPNNVFRTFWFNIHQEVRDSFGIQ